MTYGKLRRYKMKLDPAKCVFEIDSDKLMGFMASEGGIAANLEKIEAMMTMSPPRNINKVQRLTRWISMLNRFVSLSTDKCLSFVKVLRKAQS